MTPYDPFGADVEELEAAELAPAGLVLEDRLVEERPLRAFRFDQLPPQLHHGGSLAVQSN